MRIHKKFHPFPFSYHQEIELEIESLTNLGIGLGRHNGWVVMVPFALPGEKIIARIYRNFKNYSEGDLIEVLRPSKDRVTPKCSLFGTCGGCQYQNFSYDKQLEWKRKQVEEIFLKIGKVKISANQPIASPKLYHYRSKITPHFQKVKDFQKGTPIGFLKQGTRSTIIDVPHCPIATKNINEALKSVREAILNGEKKYKKGGTLLLRETQEGVITDNKAVVTESVGAYDFKFFAGEFFQNNPYILPLMVEHVIQEAKAEGIEFLIDGYCGVGVFALSGSSLFKEVTGVEINENAITWARTNATLNKVQNCQFIVGAAEAIFKGIAYDTEKTSIILDPPRKGCDLNFIEQLISYAPKRIVYVSCEPSTQARDIHYLLEKGYQITNIQPFDLFPQTRHIENVATLEIS